MSFGFGKNETISMFKSSSNDESDLNAEFWLSVCDWDLNEALALFAKAKAKEKDESKEDWEWLLTNDSMIEMLAKRDLKGCHAYFIEQGVDLGFHSRIIVALAKLRIRTHIGVCPSSHPRLLCVQTSG